MILHRIIINNSNNRVALEGIYYNDGYFGILHFAFGL